MRSLFLMICNLFFLWAITACDSHSATQQTIEQRNQSEPQTLNVKTYDVTKTKALIEAINDWDIDLAKKAISEGANPNGIDENVMIWPNEGALHLAAKKRWPELVEILLNAGADVNLRSKFNKLNTPLHYAVETNSTEICKLLMKNNADANITNSNNEVAFQQAFHLHNFVSADAISLITDTKFKIELLKEFLLKPIQSQLGSTRFLISHGVDINYSFDGHSLLSTVVGLEQKSDIFWLLENGADVNFSDSLGRSTTEQVLSIKNVELRIELLQSFFEYGLHPTDAQLNFAIDQQLSAEAKLLYKYKPLAFSKDTEWRYLVYANLKLKFNDTFKIKKIAVSDDHIYALIDLINSSAGRKNSDMIFYQPRKNFPLTGLSSFVRVPGTPIVSGTDDPGEKTIADIITFENKLYYVKNIDIFGSIRVINQFDPATGLVKTISQITTEKNRWNDSKIDISKEGIFLLEMNHRYLGDDPIGPLYRIYKININTGETILPKSVDMCSKEMEWGCKDIFIKTDNKGVHIFGQDGSLTFNYIKLSSNDLNVISNEKISTKNLYIDKFTDYQDENIYVSHPIMGFASYNFKSSEVKTLAIQNLPDSKLRFDTVNIQHGSIFILFTKDFMTHDQSDGLVVFDQTLLLGRSNILTSMELLNLPEENSH